MGMVGPAVGGRADGGKESRGADGAGASAICMHVSVFWAALHASGAAAQPELTPPLHRSVNLMCSCLQLRLPIHMMAREFQLPCLSTIPASIPSLHCAHTLCSLSPHEATLMGGTTSLSGTGVSVEHMLWTTAMRCASIT